MFGGVKLAAVVLLAALSFFDGAAAPAQAPEGCPADCHRPDALIRRWSESDSVGDGVYNRNSLGQTRVALVRAQGRARYVATVQNDGNDVDDLDISGSRNATHFWVRYFLGDQEVSARVRAGSFHFRAVPAGESRELTIEVTAKSSAPVGSKATARVLVRSHAEPTLLDRVKTVTYRSQGRETQIEGDTFTDLATAQRWAENEDATPRFVANAPIYFEVGTERGIRPEIAYAQSALETGFGHFGGVVDATFRNPCGLKTTVGGANDDPNAHQRFTTWREGITACIDHLALYAGAAGYPRAVTPDPRHFDFLYATAPTVERLGGRWAPSPDYGHNIVDGFLNPLLGS